VNHLHLTNRRSLLKLTGSIAAAGVLGIAASRLGVQVPSHAAIDTDRSRGTPDSGLRPPGTYQFSGTVRLQAPLVEIDGISNAQQISWSAGSLGVPVATFSSFEHFEQPWQFPEIRVRGGTLEALKVVPLSFA
jgi:hypothetical protein